MVLSYKFEWNVDEEHGGMCDDEHVHFGGIFGDESEKRLPISLRDHGRERTECDQFRGNADSGIDTVSE